MTTYKRPKKIKSPARFHGNGYLVTISDVTSTKRLKCYCLEISVIITMKFIKCLTAWFQIRKILQLLIKMLLQHSHLVIWEFTSVTSLWIFQIEPSSKSCEDWTELILEIIILLKENYPFFMLFAARKTRAQERNITCAWFPAKKRWHSWTSFLVFDLLQNSRNFD